MPPLKTNIPPFGPTSTPIPLLGQEVHPSTYGPDVLNVSGVPIPGYVLNTESFVNLLGAELASRQGGLWSPLAWLLGGSSVRKSPDLFPQRSLEDMSRFVVRESLSHDRSLADLQAAYAREHAVFLERAKTRWEERVSLHSDSFREPLGHFVDRAIALQQQAQTLCQEITGEVQLQNETGSHESRQDLARKARARYLALEEIIYQIEMLEMEFQTASYRDLVGQLKQHSTPLSRSQSARFEKALEDFVAASNVHLDFHRHLIDNKPLFEKNRKSWPSEYKRKKLEDDAYKALLETLHHTVQNLYRECHHPGADAVKLLSFTLKDQAEAQAHVPQGMIGLFPFFGIALNVGHVVPKLDGADLDRAAMELFGLPVILTYHQHLRLLSSAHNASTPHPQFHKTATTPTLGGIAWLDHHTLLDYALITAALYFLGLPPASILAEKAFKKAPTLGGFLDKRGVLMDRKRKDSIQKSVEDMAGRVWQGLLACVYGTGTRRLSNPIVSPNADLNRHPEALLAGGAWMFSREVSPYIIDVNLAAIRQGALYFGEPPRVPLHVCASKAGSVSGPDLPRGKEWLGSKRNGFPRVHFGETDAWFARAGTLFLQDWFDPNRNLLADQPTREEALSLVAMARQMEMNAGWFADTGISRISQG